METTPKLNAHVKRAFPTFRELEEAADAVESLASHRGWQVVTRILEAESAEIDEALDERLHEHTKYAHLHGRRGGILMAAKVIGAIQGRFAGELAEQQKKHEAAETAERS